MTAADTLMLDTVVRVAVGRAGRDRGPIAVDRNPAFWTLRPAAFPPRDGWERVGVVEPGDDPVGLMKRLHTARQQGERIPASVPRVDPAVAARETTPVETPPAPATARPVSRVERRRMAEAEQLTLF